MHNLAPPPLSDSRLEMRVGLPSEASSCRWSARGPRDRPERRRSGLAHVVRAQLSFFFFLTKWDFARLCRGWGIYKGANLAAIFFLSLFIFISNWKRAHSESDKLSQNFTGRLKSGRWPAAGEDFTAGRGKRDPWVEKQSPFPVAPGP